MMDLNKYSAVGHIAPVFLYALISLCFQHATAGNVSGQAAVDLPDAEISPTLQSISSQIRNNYMRIGTWSGEIKAEYIWVHRGVSAEDFFRTVTDAQGDPPKAILQTAESMVKFAVDAKRDCIYVDTVRENPAKYFNYETRQNLGNKGANRYWSTRIGMPDGVMEAIPQAYSPKDGTIIRRTGAKETRRVGVRTGLYGYDVTGDPRSVFFASANFTWEDLESMMKKIQGHGNAEVKGYRLKVERSGSTNTVLYKVTQPAATSPEPNGPDDFMIITRVFSAPCGLNMVFFGVETGGGKKVQEFTWDYELVNGVYVPKKATRIYYTSEGDLSTKMDYAYLKNEVNKPLPPETFMISNLRLKDGESFIDNTTKKEFRYEETTHSLKPLTK